MRTRFKIQKTDEQLEEEERQQAACSGESTCQECGGEMTWCESCRKWSSYCCETYGTCMCS